MIDLKRPHFQFRKQLLIMN